jgi:predicted Kef-type K+ transport protein
LALGEALALAVALGVAFGLEALDLVALDLVALGLGVLAEESETASRTTAVWPAGTDRAAEVRAGG